MAVGLVAMGAPMALFPQPSFGMSTDLKVVESKIDTRDDLLHALRGQRLNIPDLEALISHWPHSVHTQIDHLREDVNQKLQEYGR